MIGIGKWHGSVKSKIFTGEVDVEVIDNNGEYAFDIKLPDKFAGVKFEYYDTVEKGNTLTCKGKRSMLPKLTINAEVTFDGDNMTAKLTTPLMPGAIKINDGRRVG